MLWSFNSTGIPMLTKLLRRMTGKKDSIRCCEIFSIQNDFPNTLANVVNFILEHTVQTRYYTIGLNNFATAKSQKLGTIQKGVQEISCNHVYPRNACTFQETFERLHKPEHRIHRAWWCSHWFMPETKWRNGGRHVLFREISRPWRALKRFTCARP